MKRAAGCMMMMKQKERSRRSGHLPPVLSLVVLVVITRSSVGDDWKKGVSSVSVSFFSPPARERNGKEGLSLVPRTRTAAAKLRAKDRSEILVLTPLRLLVPVRAALPQSPEVDSHSSHAPSHACWRRTHTHVRLLSLTSRRRSPSTTRSG